MVAASEVSMIVEATRSEVKRWGGDGASLTHAALVLSSRYKDEFEAVFGSEGAERVKSLLRARRFRGDEDTLQAMLKDVEVKDSLQAIHDALREDLDTLEAPPEESATVATTSPEPTGSDPMPAEEETGEVSARLARSVHLVEPNQEADRQADIADLAAHLLRARPPLCALIGERGIGKTFSIGGLAATLGEQSEPLNVYRLAPDTIVANPSTTLRLALEDIKDRAVLVLDDFDELARLGTEFPDRELIGAVEEARHQTKVRLVLVVDRRYDARLGVLSQALDQHLCRVSLGELSPSRVLDIAQAEGALLAETHGVELDQAVVAAAVVPGVAADGIGQPGLAVDRLDLACARAVLSGEKRVSVSHLSDASPIPVETHNLAVQLGERVKGQHEAVEKVATRLALTRANLDLRPERPNGVFLFVGPTGVGKTELAKEIAVQEYGGLDRLIRLDMSEFAQEWSITRLVGPSPGYVGSTEPESWLTTRVAATPNCVVLLDEIEKAHPRVWNTFLQVFDAGRLTDGRGVTADFSRAVVIMTSNLGVQEASSRAVGFSGTGGDANRGRLLAAVRESMAPELLNRLDEIIVFSALSMDAIIEIARHELDSVSNRLAAAGWSIEFDEGVPEWLAQTGYDPTYGARHLQRNIEREFLALLATVSDRRIRVSPAGNKLSVAIEHSGS